MKEFLHNQYKNLLLWGIIILSFGAALYFSLNYEPNIWIIISSFIIGLVSLCGVKRFSAICIASFFTIGFGYSGLYTHFQDVPYIEHDIHGIEIAGKITQLDYTDDKTRIYLDTENYGKVRVSTTTDTTYNIGDIISGTGGLFHPKPADIPNGFDFARWMYFKNISATGYIKDIKTLYTAESSVYNIRNNMQQTCKSFLCDSLILGYKSTMPTTHRDIWATNGMAHIWSISGYHTTLIMGWLFVIFYFMFRLCPKLVRRVPARIPAIICAWVGLIGYVFLSGGSIATLRAFLMATLAMMAIIFGRNILSLRMAAIAFIILFMINPLFIMQTGFQLSFSCIFGILWLWQTLKPQMPSNKILKYLYASVLTATIATVFSSAFIMLHFGKLQMYGIIGNMIFLPIFSLILMPLVIIGAISTIFGFYAPISFAHSVYEYMFTIAGKIANTPMSEINIGNIPNASVLFIIIGLGCIIFIINNDRFKYLLLRHMNYMLGAIFVIIGIIVAAFTPRPVFYISPNHKLIGAVIDNKLQFNKTRDSSNYFAFDTWKQSNGENTGTDNIRLAKESGVYRVSFKDFSVCYIQNFVPLAKNLSTLCNDTEIKYIVSYFNIHTNSACASKIIHGGGVIYKSGRFIPISAHRLWHNRHQ